MQFFKYIIEYFDKLEERNITAKGFVIGRDYGEAMKNLDEYYVNIINVKGLYAYEDSLVYELNEERKHKGVAPFTLKEIE